MVINLDVAIIGGGIHGMGVAADAAGRGLNVAVFEQHDLGSQTSNASTKLIHGGLRYLETHQYQLVYDCLKEQKTLLANAAHLVAPLEFVIPIDLSIRPQWLIKIGLVAYDLLRFNGLPRCRILSSQQRIALNLQHAPSAAFSYYDCQTDDHRLVISDAIIARSFGAKIYNYTQVHTIVSTQEGWIIRIEHKGSIQSYRAKSLILLAGPWIREAFQTYHLPFAPPEVSFVQGAHIIVKKLYEGAHALAYQHADGRLIFFVPYFDQWTLLGTTDHPVNGPTANPEVSAKEQAYLLNIANQAFGLSLTTEQICSQYAGIRCLINDSNAGARTSRESQILVYHCPSYGHTMLSLVGGKLTSWRSIAEKIVNKLKKDHPHMGPAWTHKKIAAGAQKNFNLQSMIHFLGRLYPFLPYKTLERFSRLYGMRTEILMKDVFSMKDLGVMIISDLSVKEVSFLQEHEWAVTFEDIIDRRTRIGLELSTAERTRGLQRFYRYCEEPAIKTTASIGIE